MNLRAVVLVVVLGVLGNDIGCGPCGTPVKSPEVNITNMTDHAIVVDYEVGRLFVENAPDYSQSQRVLELPPGQLGSFAPFPMIDACLLAPVVVRAEATDEVLNTTPEGTCLGTGITIIID